MVDQLDLEIAERNKSREEVMNEIRPHLNRLVALNEEGVAEGWMTSRDRSFFIDQINACVPDLTTAEIATVLLVVMTGWGGKKQKVA
jgi:hypothetical protein